MNLKRATDQLMEAYLFILEYFSKKKNMSGVKLLTTANSYVLEKCMSVFEKFASQI